LLSCKRTLIVLGLFAFGSYNMRLEMLMQVKQAIGFKKQNKSIREIAGTLGVAKSTVWSILRKKECTGELSNIVVDDCMDPLKGKENNIHNIQTSE